MRIAFVGNQGGRDVIAVYAAMARTLIDEFAAVPRFAVWLDAELPVPAEFGIAGAEVSSFESHVGRTPPAGPSDADRLNREYRDVNWSEVVAAERAFTDYSMLLGAAGDRRETPAYAERLVVSIVRYLETVVDGCDAVVCQTADTLFSLIVFKVARHRGIPVFALSPAWLLEPGQEGGFFANNEFLECDRMVASFAARQGRAITPPERDRCDALIGSIRGFVGKTEFLATMSSKAKTGGQVLTPQITRLLRYVVENARRDKYVEYTKIEPSSKVRANLRRLVRKAQSRRLVGPRSVDVVPAKSVFFALHFQPEQSTLAQGVWYVNQVAVVENISKALPLGYTLVVKEHPWSRGVRPAWQYRHLARLPNVIFCDAPAKDIVRRVQAVVTITGTVGMEALVLGTPTVMLGRTFYDFSDLLYHVRDVQDLPDVLKRILLDRDYDTQPDKEARLQRFLLAYLDGVIPAFPLAENGAIWARALARELAGVPHPACLAEATRG